MNLLSIIVAVALIYLLIIFGVMLINKSSVIEARNKVNTFIKEVFFTETPQPQQAQWTYGIQFGIDADGNAHADIIEREFDGLKKIFNDFSFYGYERQTNCIAYAFIVDEPILELNDEELYALCLKRCTTMVHRIIHHYNPYVGYISDLVSCKIYGNIVIIYIAENDAGRKENALFLGQMRKVLKQQQQTPKTTKLEESWNA